VFHWCLEEKNMPIESRVSSKPEPHKTSKGKLQFALLSVYQSN
jgi:hypothetical protein